VMELYDYILLALAIAGVLRVWYERRMDI
jgi:hypothetical protein